MQALYAKGGSVSNKIVLFDNELTKSALRQFIVRLEMITTVNDFELTRNSMIRLILDAMVHNPQEWDDSCQINIDWIGKSFVNRISNADVEFSKSNLDNVCSNCFRFLFELYLSTNNSLSIDFEESKNFVINNADKFEEKARGQIKFTTEQMPIAIFKSIANSDGITSIKEFENLSNKAEKLRQEWDADIIQKLDEAKILKDELSKYKTAFNFVGLYQGFDELSSDKKLEKSNLLFWLRIMGMLITLPLLLEIIVILFHVNNIEEVRNVILISFIPAASLVAISIYYFRVLLFNYKSVQSQLLQIELRKTLCRFIHNYADYSKELKDKGQDSLVKFENIIFSGIVSEDGALPSTYDGIDQIGKLLKSIKS